MAKTVIKETFIILLSTVAIGLVLAVIFYKFIPSNKMIPIQVTEYSAPAEVRKEVSESTSDELSKSYEVYEITDSDLDLFKSTKSYNPGKVDPFSSGPEVDSNSTAEDPGASSEVSAPSGNSSAPIENSSASDVNTTESYYEASHIEGRHKIILGYIYYNKYKYITQFLLRREKYV